ncbi:MAG TPA: lipid A deacylase LpxR family protein, partial [Crenalkalicoccus sp.]|nr:lipid A deacylase LpxR family protein [Crenalkalicoccus sp.]
MPIGLLAALPLVLASAPGRAQAPAEAPGEVRLPPADPRFILDLVTENDAYVRNTDRWYTSGIRLGWHSAEDNLPSPVAWLDRSLAELFGPARSRWGIAIGQTFYTPRDKQLVIPDPQDRPYAGYLFGEFTLDRRTWTTLDRFSLQLGVVGPAAQAKETQDFVHHILGDRPARGWNFQLRNEPVFNLGWDRIWRVPLAALPFGLGVDALPTLELAAGTVQIYAAGGGRLRIGQGLDQDFGPPRIRPTIADGATPVGQGFGWYAFVGAGGRAIARD